MFERPGSVSTLNRAPVLTLWAAVVAERLGYDRDEAATPGRAVAAPRAFALYEAFRPGIPAGVKGWGAKGRARLGGRALAGRQGPCVAIARP